MHQHTQDHHRAPTSRDNAHSDGLIDPVCGMAVKPSTPHRARHDVQDHLFCSSGCREKFQREPGRFVIERGPADGRQEVTKSEKKPAGAEDVPLDTVQVAVILPRPCVHAGGEAHRADV